MFSTLAHKLINWRFGVGNYSIFLFSLFSDVFDFTVEFNNKTSSYIADGQNG